MSGIAGITLRMKGQEICRRGAFLLRVAGGDYVPLADAAAIAGLTEDGFLDALRERRERGMPAFLATIRAYDAGGQPVPVPCPPLLWEDDEP